ncbi:MAG: response regulator [Chloroflexi bacterium]|nr:response regulator [Chloroflexota bacterium]
MSREEQRRPETDPRLADRGFLANLRHEYRTPINHIIGYTEMLQEESEEQDFQDLAPDLGRIHAAGQQLLALVNASLDVAKVETVGIDLSGLREELRTPLNAIIGYSELLQEQAEETRRDSMVPDLGKICSAARNLLDLVNENLVLTATESAESPIRPEPASGPGWSLQPAAVERPQATVFPVTKTGAGSLLVVDDNEMNRDMLSRRLERQGHTVAVAEGGRQALEMVRSEPFDLVLLDIMMPDVDGYQVLRGLKSDSTLRHIPVIMLSALDEMDSVVRCIQMGAEDHLSKPFDPVLLHARIGACLEKKRLRDQERLHLQQIEHERKRADDLLHVILPGPVVDELKATSTVKPRRYENVAVLFCDIVGFTAYCDVRQPEEVITSLQDLVEVYEDLALRHGLEKIKTIGDSFMAAAGLLKPLENPVLNCVRCGLEMISAARVVPSGWQVRIGIDFGPVVAGVVGRRQYLFDLWGDTVNTAARIESHGSTGSVNLSRLAWEQVQEQYTARWLGMTEVKGKGYLEIFALYQQGLLWRERLGE